MIVKVKLFARARELVGQDQVALELDHGATIQQVRESLVVEHPRLGEILSRCRLALDSELAEDEQSVSPRSEIALIPPVSGGCHGVN